MEIALLIVVLLALTGGLIAALLRTSWKLLVICLGILLLLNIYFLGAVVDGRTLRGARIETTATNKVPLSIERFTPSAFDESFTGKVYRVVKVITNSTQYIIRDLETDSVRFVADPTTLEPGDLFLVKQNSTHRFGVEVVGRVKEK